MLDCRGLPTVQVDLAVGGGAVAAGDVPWAARRAPTRPPSFATVATVSVASASWCRQQRQRGDRASACRASVPSQRELDTALIELDGTEDKSRLGQTRCSASRWLRRGRSSGRRQRPLYRNLNANAHLLPVPLVNLINGGKHASNDLDFQEFIVFPVGADSMLEALQISTEVNLALAEILLARYGKVALNTGDEGGFAPAISARGGTRPAARGGRRRRATGRSVRARLRGNPLLRPDDRQLRARRRDAAIARR